METVIKNLLKSSSKLVGTKQVLKGLSEGTIRCVIVATDTDSFIKNKIVAHTKKAEAEILWCDTMEKLGKMCEIDVGASVVGIMKQLQTGK